MTYQLKPGDILLYKPSGLFGWVISIKTWHHISHVEVYLGGKKSLASRDGIGVGEYPTRTSGLAYVLRPTASLNWKAALHYFLLVNGKPYGWLDLLNFIGLPFRTRGMFCSQFATELFRHAGWEMFPTDEADAVAPFQFLDLVGAGCEIVYAPAGAGSLSLTSK